MKNLNSPFKNNNDKPILITGPCSAETLDQVLSTAQELKENNTCTYFRSGIWKPRTRPNSFEGVGESGIPWLLEVKKQFGFPVATEVANKHHLEACLKNGIDLVWIGARTTASPFAMQELADVLQGVDIPVLVKNPVNAELNLGLGGWRDCIKRELSKLVQFIAVSQELKIQFTETFQCGIFQWSLKEFIRKFRLFVTRAIFVEEENLLLKSHNMPWILVLMAL